MHIICLFRLIVSCAFSGECVCDVPSRRVVCHVPFQAKLFWKCHICFNKIYFYVKMVKMFWFKNWIYEVITPIKELEKSVVTSKTMDDVEHGVVRRWTTWVWVRCKPGWEGPGCVGILTLKKFLISHGLFQINCILAPIPKFNNKKN